MPVNLENYDDLLNYHAPAPDQVEAFNKLRLAAKAFVRAILLETPFGADQQAAIRSARVALFQANAAVALRGRG